jgi:DNA-binding YbaB/EbfC family protein
MNMNQLMKQAQAMQQKLAEEQQRIAVQTFEGSAGGGLVNVTVNGKSELLKITIDPSLMVADEVDVLEDLIMAAMADGKKKADDNASGVLGSMMSGMGLPPGLGF